MASSYDKHELIESWGLRHCVNCNRLWCRDRCATGNMMSRTLWLLTQIPNELISPSVLSPSNDGVLAVRVRRPYKLDGPSYLRRQARVASSSTTTTSSSSVHGDVCSFFSFQGNQGGQKPPLNAYLSGSPRVSGQSDSHTTFANIAKRPCVCVFPVTSTQKNADCLTFDCSVCVFV